MKKIFFPLFGTCFFLFCQASALEKISKAPSLTADQQAAPSAAEKKEEGVILFTPPSGWHMADRNLLPQHVRAMVVGKGPSSFPPSMNISWEPYKGTLRQYLKIIKNMNSAQGYDWKDLGTIRTEAGTASLSQVDTKTQWGDVRLMHVILTRNGNVYILTASALKDEFSIFYKDFFAAMRSLRFGNDIVDSIADPQQRAQLKSEVNKLQMQWQTILAAKQKEYPEMPRSEIQENAFNSSEFQNTIWKPFLEMLEQKYAYLGPEWQYLFQQNIRDQLYSVYSETKF